MWHEAKRQGKKITGMLVDYRKRAERRRDYYESIKADPSQFLQIHGRQCKIHLDPNMATTAEKAIMMYWQENLIDRFDVRVHLDSAPCEDEFQDVEEILTQEERQLNYERYRIIAQNTFLKIPEEKFLKQLHLEEQYGYNDIKTKKDCRTGVSIGFNYEESGVINQNVLEESDYDDSDLDLDVDLIINVSKLDTSQANEMNKHGCNFGMSSNDFYSFLINDLEEAEALKLAKEEEQEKSLFSGRKSRRERRSHREKKLANRRVSPPSYAAKSSPVRTNRSKSRSRSLSPAILNKITYITSFGDDEEPSTSKSVENKAKSKKVFNKKNSIRGRSKYRRNTSSRYRRNSSTSTSSSRSSRKSKKFTRYCRRRDYSSFSSSSQHSSPSHQVKQNCKARTISSEPVKVLTRYYGRKKCDTSSSSSESDSNLDSASLTRQTPITKKPSNNSIIERLKKKRQVLISKRFKADKIAEKLKSEREKLEQRTRDDELREMSLKLRRKQREIRHANDSYNTSNDSNFSSGSNSSSRSRGKYRSLKQTNKETRERSLSKNRRRESGKIENLSRRNSKDIDGSCLLNKLVNY